jgi:hypothetical protein
MRARETASERVPVPVESISDGHTSSPIFQDLFSFMQ